MLKNKGINYSFNLQGVTEMNIAPPPKLQGWSAHQDTLLVHFRTTAQGSKPFLITHLRANLALTLTKLVLRTKDLNSMFLDGLEVFLGVCV